VSTSRSIVAVLLASLMAIAACSPAPGKPAESVVVQPADPSFIHGTDGSDIDRLAATVVTEVQRYWAAEFPADFGTPWRDLDGGFFSVDTTATNGRPPPCSGASKEVEGNAYFCAAVDAVAWDRSALLPVLRERYGETSVVVVLAHEIGHAVQQRSGMDVGGADHRDRPLRTESMADCYAGSFVRWVTDGHSPRLRINPAQLDTALRALIVFRDPIGTAASDAHGTAFDRVSAFQDGYRDGSRRCSAVEDETRKLTDSEPDPGNRPVDDIVRSADVPSFFARLVTDRGRRWNPPSAHWSTEPAARCARAVTPVAYCTRPPGVIVDRDALTALRRDIGDHAGTTLLASRYAVAAMDALGRPLAGAAAGRQAVCLSGAYTGSLARQQGVPLSPGDLDEALEVLLVQDGVSRDVTGSNSLTGFDRIAAFRTGAVGGPGACGL
jgi:predicted metalloprotease